MVPFTRVSKRTCMRMYSINTTAVIVLLFICYFASPPRSWPYHISTEVHPPGWIEAGANDINNDGTVVGSGKDGNGNERGFVFRLGTYKTLIPPGWRRSAAISINNNDAVVGHGLDDVNKGFLYIDGEYISLFPSGWREAYALGINDKANVVGYGRHGRSYKGFLYSKGSYTEILPPGWQEAYAYGINNEDIIVGFGIDEKMNSRGFVYSDGHYTTILPSGWQEAKTVDINDRGEVVGFGLTGANLPNCFIYRAGSYAEITSREVKCLEVSGMNNRGAVVGRMSHRESDMKGFIYEGVSMRTLQPEKWIWSQPYALNDRGDVVGSGSYGSGKKGFIMTGTPDIVVDPTVIFFGGNVHEWMLDDKTITVRNIGSGALTIDPVSGPEYPYTVAEDTCSGQTLDQMQSCHITYRVSKTSETTVRGKTHIHSNDPEQSSVELIFGIFPDSDNDGFTVDIDCDDSDQSVHPGIKETMNNRKDDDCNPETRD